MKQNYFVLLIVAVMGASAAKGQGHLADTASVPDSIKALNSYYFNVEKLAQYQKEKIKLQSSIRNGEVLLAVHIIPQSFFKEDSGKAIIAAFINEEWKTRSKIAYIVRFDSTHRVLSVSKHHSMTPEETASALGVTKKQRD